MTRAKSVNIGERNRDYYVGQTETEDGHQHHGEDEVRERPQYVDDTHDDHVEPAAVVARSHAEDDPYTGCQNDSTQSDDHRDARSDDDAAEHIAPDVVRSQRMLDGWGRQQLIVLSI